MILADTLEMVLLDRDGVISRNRDDYVKSWGEFEFLPGAFENLRRLNDAGLRLAVVTSQSLVGRGMVPRATVDDINARMHAALAAAGVRMDGVYTCPHHPDDGCDCRKPAPGLVLRAARELKFDPARSCIIGDVYGDAMAGIAAGCRFACVIPSNRDPGPRPPADRLPPDRLIEAAGLAEAVDHVLSHSGREQVPGEIVP